ncbi:MAG: hypothetical protein QM784_13730 [Polyangiaceae bacterium]
MNLERIERLKGLLSRVERNAKLPRAVTRAPHATESDVHAKAAPSATAAVPAIASPVAASVSSASAKRADSVVPLITPLAKAPTPVAKPVEPAATSRGFEPQAELEDVALDDLAVELPSHEAAVEVSSPLGTAAKAAAADRANAEAAKQELKSAPVAVPPIEDLAAEDIELEDVSFDDIAEVAPPVSAPSHTDVQASATPFTAQPSLDDLTFSEPPPPASVAPSEPPPVSARKSVDEAPDSIDAALIAATAAQNEAESELEEAEAPLLTPPPESGRQPARPSSAQHPETASHRPAAPTVEQLGEVVELEEVRGPVLELQESPSKVRQEGAEDLEFIPPASVQAPAEVPPREALSTLVGATLDEDVPPSSRRPIASARPQAAEPEDVFADEAPTTTAALAPEVTARRPVQPSRPVVDVVASAQGFRPRSFLELLDASLNLGKKS